MIVHPDSDRRGVASTPRDGEWPLSLNQATELLREWWVGLKTGEPSPCHLLLALELTGPANLVALQQAIQTVASRHDVLRSSFPDLRHADVRMQKALFAAVAGPDMLGTVLGTEILKATTHAHAEVPVTVLTQSLNADDDLIQALRPLVAEELRAPFEYEHPPLCRATVVRLDRSRHVLLVTVHHLVADAWSLQLLRGELEALYERFSVGCTARAVPVLSAQYRDFAASQRRRFDGREEASVVLWTNHWRRYADAVITASELGSASAPRAVGRESCEIQGRASGRFSDRCLSFCAAHRATPYMMWLSSLIILLYGQTRRERMAIFGHAANRIGRDTRSLIGWFENAVLLGVEISGRDTIAGVLQRVRESVLQASSHQHVPVPVIWQALARAGALKAALLSDDHVSFDVGWIARERPVRLVDGAAVKEISILRPPEPGSGSFDVRILGVGPDLRVAAKYPSGRFAATAVEHMLHHLVRIADAMSGDPEARVDAVLRSTSAA